eukprot:10733241-Alexandrium_andersonii.AAC.1
MCRLEHRALGQEACRQIRAFLAEAICEHVTDPAWRAAFIALEGPKPKEGGAIPKVDLNDLDGEAIAHAL